MMAAAAPRCGRLMVRYEPSGWPPVLEQPSCGRPEGHHGPCRSPRSIALALQGDMKRQVPSPEPCACGCGELAIWGKWRRGHNGRARGGYWARTEAA